LSVEGTPDRELQSTSTSSDGTMMTTAATESPSTEIPSSEFISKREGKEGTAVEKRKLVKEKRSRMNKDS
jgi:hypothetical protein